MSTQLFHETHEYLNTQMTKIVMGGRLEMRESEYQRPSSYAMAVIAHKMMDRRLLEDLAWHNSLYGIPRPRLVRPGALLFGQGKNSHKPKWGQRGRGRKRKMRLADRARKHR